MPVSFDNFFSASDFSFSMLKFLIITENFSLSFLVYYTLYYLIVEPPPFSTEKLKVNLGIKGLSEEIKETNVYFTMQEMS